MPAGCVQYGTHNGDARLVLRGWGTVCMIPICHPGASGMIAEIEVEIEKIVKIH